MNFACVLSAACGAADERIALASLLSLVLPTAPGSEPDAVVENPPRREAVLYVDDDINILHAFRRQFRSQFAIETALGPEEALETIAAKGPFAVVISDLRMPGMDGNQFLAAVRAKSPDTVRVMLTGQADLPAAIAAVNQGSIFRFLLKPSPPTILGHVIQTALEQYRLLMAERQFTEQTLLGCLRVMGDLLGVIQPSAFGQLNRLRRYIVGMADGLVPARDIWQFEAAALLSRIGWIALPPDITGKLGNQEPLTQEEQSKVQEQAACAARMISGIPRIERVAQMIELQHRRFDEWRTGASDPVVALGAQMLKAACDFDDWRRDGLSSEDALLRMRSRPAIYNISLLDALRSADLWESEAQAGTVRLREMAPGMILEEDIRSTKGICLMAKGQEITETICQRLLGFRHLVPPEARFKIRARPDVRQA